MPRNPGAQTTPGINIADPRRRHRSFSTGFSDPEEPHPMNITIFGTGYVGLVTGACFAESGNNVYCVDVDEKKINDLKNRIIPIYEPGLEELVEQNSAAGRLHFTTDAKEGVDHGRFIFIAVGTPPNEDGSSDLKYVETVARTIGDLMTQE